MFCTRRATGLQYATARYEDKDQESVSADQDSWYINLDGLGMTEAAI